MYCLLGVVHATFELSSIPITSQIKDTHTLVKVVKIRLHLMLISFMSDVGHLGVMF